MNFSVHLPQPLLIDLDRFVKTNKLSGSGVVRQGGLAQKTKSEWSPELLAWMQEGMPPEFKPDIDADPDFHAIRRETNESRVPNTARNLKDFEA